MTEHPILFSAPMVRALLAGTKTQTRRVAKVFQDRPHLDGILRRYPNQRGCPYGAPGDMLWVREGGELLRVAHDHDPALGIDLWQDAGWVHSADGAVVPFQRTDPPLSEWIDDCARHRRPSIHMPRWASRLTLRITDVRVERLNEISEADARAEGVRQWPDGRWSSHDAPLSTNELAGADAATGYRLLWEEINGHGSWAANPWVWAVSFEIANAPEGA